MSAATIHKLERLLSRVQERRAEPRLQAVAADAPLSQTIDAPFSAPPPATGRVSKVPVPTPLEESMELLVPVERPAVSVPSAFQAPPPPAPDSEELVLDDFEPAAPVTLQPMADSAPTVAPLASVPAVAPVAAMPPVAAVAPVAPVAPVAAAPVVAPVAAPITAPTARIAPAVPVASASPVASVSAARHMEPKSFGELLDLSLALRPTKS